MATQIFRLSYLNFHDYLVQMEREHWVAGHLTDGLGNRLFQHAAAAGLAEKWRYPLVFCTNECGPTNHGPFDTIFKLFPTVPLVSTTERVERLLETKGGTYTYTPFPDQPTSNCVSIDGCRQTELYFPTAGIQPNFEHAIPVDRRKTLLEYYNLDTEEKRLHTWFLHIRLGDYKILPHHQINMHSYYSQAIPHIPENRRILLFCDEIEKFGVYLEGFLRQMGAEVIQVNVPDELDTLFIMSNCWGGAVVANSTFSWWGAYFAKQFHPTPSLYKAIYPSVWGKGLPEARDIIPSWGIRIQNT